GNAAVRGNVLVLLPYRLLQKVNLDMASLLRQLLRRNESPAQGVQRLQQRGRKAPRRAQPGPRRYVREAYDIEVRSRYPREFHGLPDDRVLDILNLLYFFHLRVFQPDHRPEGFADGDVNVALDRRRQHESHVFFIIGRQVRAASALVRFLSEPCELNSPTLPNLYDTIHTVLLYRLSPGGFPAIRSSAVKTWLLLGVGQVGTVLGEE